MVIMVDNSQVMQMLVDKIEEIEIRLHNLEKFAINYGNNTWHSKGDTECQ
tara:strand:+ start:383 stop:532 length:150 start_codon:yes stop_codon:yes gene_type:complete